MVSINQKESTTRVFLLVSIAAPTHNAAFSPYEIEMIFFVKKLRRGFPRRLVP